MAHPLHRLFAPRGIAVVGASPKGGYGLTTLRNLRDLGYPGRLYVVHPTRDEVDGVPAYPSVGALPEPVDAVAVAVPAAGVPGVLRDAAAAGVPTGVVYGSGFAELDEAGKALQAEVRDAGVRVVGPNCLGVVSYRHRAALWGIGMPGGPGPDGTIALAAQSGNMALTTMGSGRLPGLAYAVSAGNQAVLDVTDCVEYFLTDPAVRVIGVIVEGLRDLTRFRALATAAAERDVAVVVLKVGRSAKGEAATIAHTGTLAGVDAAYAAAFRQSGAIRVDDLEELVAVCAMLAGPRRPRGTGLGIFASSGGECGLIADLAEDTGVELAALDEPARATLAPILPAYGQLGNPLDLTAGGWGQHSVYATATAGLGRVPGVDLVAFVGDAPANSGDLAESGWPEMLGGAAEGAAGLDVPVALVTTTTDTVPELATLAQAHGVLLLPGLRTALRALALAGTWAHRSLAGAAATAAGPVAAAREVLAAADGRVLPESAAKRLLTHYGVPVPDGGDAADPESAVLLARKVGFPVVCKIDADGLAHKSDIGGVEVGLADEDAVRAAVDRVLAAGRAAATGPVRGVRIERMAEGPGVELIVGGRTDPVAGPLVVIGAGGVLTELLADAAQLLWPFTADQVVAAVRALRIGRLLAGYRGAPPADVAALAAVAVAVGRLLADLPEVAEIDVNPVRVGPAGAVALDALVVRHAA
ncbi:acetate--CoA ligase family protein [Asanoa sp. WMMD1127]|uniref:acetate--CoA ligase family protein n=1 Tax=Asanoa sp. WMMD1127 TaxID=3016107 RepID=UPI002415EC3D|nr:acetate--CoA ligase family protein [Asanoa sp. WMMD1127]MDG4825277.1 acetate--CoA ligase family protein [Asanoa sp. WMMD1127]